MNLGDMVTKQKVYGEYEQKELEAYSRVQEKCINMLNQIKKDGNLPKIDLERLSASSKGQNHVTISISGWLSEETNKIDHWQDLTNYLGEDEAAFSVTWESSTSRKLKIAIAKALSNISMSALLSCAGPAPKAAMMLATGSQSVIQVKEIKELYNSAKK